MDYVVYGTGYGATLMLLGYAVRTWGPGWRFRDGEEAAYDRREFQSARSAWTRFTNGLGAAIATAGAVLVLLTFILMLVNPGDSIGSTVALVVTGLLLVGIAVWSWMFFDRFGAWGVVATPDALTSYEPAHYDSRATLSDPVTAEGATPGADDDESEEPSYGADEESEDEEYDVADDDTDLVARSTKFELHHPDAEPSSEESAEEDEEWFEAQYSKYESHHPEGEDVPEDRDEADAEEIDEYVETLTPEEVGEEIVDEADEEPVEDGDVEAPIETYEDLVGRNHAGTAGDDTTIEAEADAVEDDPLEVLPEAHEDTDPLLVPDPESRQDAGGRDDALRRLRERQARRAQQRPDDDA